MSEINSWISDESDNIQLLGFAHTTKWINFEEIYPLGKITKDKSRFPPSGPNTTNMIYLFYAIPSYKVGEDVSMDFLAEKPIGMIFKPDILKTPTSCYPFDTGAYLKGLYKNVYDFSKVDINDFRVRLNGQNELQKLLVRYFGTNENYCAGRSTFEKQNKKLGSSKEDLIVKLHTYSGRDVIDDRLSAVEIHYLDDLTLTSNLLAIFLPKNAYKSNGHMFAGLDKICEIRMYNDNVRGNPKMDCKSVMDAAVQYYQDKGLLN